MSTTTKTLYDTDFVAWADETAALVRAGRLDEVDLEHVAEEIEGLAGSDRGAVRSQLESLIMHLIKQKIQPERDGASWRASIVDAQREISNYLHYSPSLGRHLSEILEQVYRQAGRYAKSETSMHKASLPSTCPWTLDQLPNSDLDELATIKAMSTTTKTLYDTDFVAWAREMAALVRAGRLDEVDLENVENAPDQAENSAGAGRQKLAHFHPDREK